MYKASKVVMDPIWLDGGAMFGIIPKTLWSKKIEADDKNRVPMQANCVLLQSEDRKIIIEVGSGTEFNEKDKSIYGYPEEFLTWDKALREFDLKCADITDVILSHLHFDHAGALMTGKSPTFQNATHYAQATQVEWAVHPTKKDRGSYRKAGIRPFSDNLVEFRLLEGDGEVLPGIRAIRVDGHSKGQQVILFECQHGQVLFASDLMPTHLHLQAAYLSAFDNEPLKTLDEKGRIREEAEKNGWKYWFFHDPDRVLTDSSGNAIEL